MLGLHEEHELQPMSKPGRPRKKPEEPRKGPTTLVGIRLDVNLAARIRALLPALSTPWRRATVSDVLRRLLLMSIDELEKEARAAKASGKDAKEEKKKS